MSKIGRELLQGMRNTLALVKRGGRFAVPLLAATLLATPVAAQTDTSELTGDELQNLCASDDDFCVGFIAGAVSATRMWALGGELAAVPFCVPDGVTYDGLVDVWLAWAARNPALLDDLATALVIAAMVDAFPC